MARLGVEDWAVSNGPCSPALGRPGKGDGRIETRPRPANRVVSRGQGEHEGYGMRLLTVLRETEVKLEGIRQNLWNADVDAASYSADNEKYQAAVLEQYKIYVEMADRISARRGLANTFFLTLNTAVFTIIGVFWKDRPQETTWLLLLPVIVLLGQCLAWFWLVRSYRQLNTAKWTVVGALEERLPASPYWRAEWKAVGEGHDPSKYWPLSHLEQWVPMLFATCYLAGFLAVVVS
jgi:hypothetical protein